MNNNLRDRLRGDTAGAVAGALAGGLRADAIPELLARRCTARPAAQRRTVGMPRGWPRWPIAPAAEGGGRICETFAALRATLHLPP